MRIILERDFLKSAKLLPKPIQKKLASQLVLLEANPKRFMFGKSIIVKIFIDK